MSVTVVAEATSNRVLANRRNAAKSTGPRTVGGKAVSRRNAVKHGLSGRGVVLPDQVEREAEARAAEWLASTRPTHKMQAELVTLAARTYTQIDFGWKSEHLARAKVIDRAETAWDLERDGVIAEMARHLPDQPERTLARLKQSAHGAAWLYERWERIVARLEAGDDWTEEMRIYALDLLGVSAPFRDRLSPVDWPELVGENPSESDLAQIRERRLAVAREQLEMLGRALDDVLIDMDEDDRALRMANVLVMPDADVSRFVRYQQFHTKRLMELLSVISLEEGRSGATAPGLPRAGVHPRPEVPSQSIEPRLPLGSCPPDRAFEPPGRREFAEAVKDSGKSTCVAPEPEVQADPEPPAEAQPACETNPTERKPVVYGKGSLLPREFYQMDLEELKLAAHEVNRHDPEQVDAYCLLLRRLVIENEIRNGR